jgi:sporulation protein YlmC with PRC-barrel domain
MQIHEAHVERLLGTKVCDANGELVGRLEEMIVAIVDGEPVVAEFHVGPAALLERIGAFLKNVPYFHLIPFPKRAYRVSWEEMDLSEPSRPRAKVAKNALRRLG